MKVRWTNGSVRLRITPTELDILLGGGVIECGLAVPGGSWRVAVERSVDTSIRMDGTVLRVTVSDRDRDRLAEPTAEGVYFSTSGDEPVRYYIEKDFPCVHPRPVDAHEQPSETFAPPPGFKQRHQTQCI